LEAKGEKPPYEPPVEPKPIDPYSAGEDPVDRFAVLANYDFS